MGGIFLCRENCLVINSRNIESLLPIVAEKARAMLAACAADGLDVIVTSCYRDHESQAMLYAQGRTTPGKIVTNARPGESWHNHRCAFDIVPIRNGKPVWGTAGADLELWMRVGEIGESVGLEWAGRWKGRLLEFAHFQYSAGLSLADLQAGKTLPIA